MGVESCNALPTSFSTRMLLYRRPHFGYGGETAIASSELSVVKLLTALACTRSGGAQRYELLDVDIGAEVIASRRVERRVGADQEDVRLGGAAHHLHVGVVPSDAEWRRGADCHQLAFFIDRDSVGRIQARVRGFGDLYFERTDRCFGSRIASRGDLIGSKLD